MGKVRSYLHCLSGVDYFDKTYIGAKDDTTNVWDHMIALCFSSTTPSGVVKDTFCTYRVSDKDFREIWRKVGGMPFNEHPTKAEVEYKIKELQDTIPDSQEFWIAWWHANHIIPHRCQTIDSIKRNRSKYHELWNASKGFPVRYWEAKKKHEARKAEKKVQVTNEY